jgi:uncharacterized protein (TIGR00106 family)
MSRTLYVLISGNQLIFKEGVMSVIAELAIFPLDKGVGVSDYVKQAVELLEQSGMPCEPGPMGTCVEGEWEEVMAAVNQCFLSMQMDCQRIYMTLKVDYRHGRADGMRSKVSAVTG